MQRAIHGALAAVTAAFGLACAGSGAEEPDTETVPTVEAETPSEAPSSPEADEPAAKDADSGLSAYERDRRGDEHLLAGRFDEAIADFDAFLAAEPHLDPQHWRRGIAYYYAGRYEDGAAQFERHRLVNPNDVENATWHFLCVARAQGVDEARAALLPVGPDQRDPMKEVYELFAGRAEAADVLAAAEASSQRDARFFAHLYLGLYHDALGDADEARHHIDLAATTHGRSHYMGGVAKVHAELLAR